jgi:hypothetical protein
LRANDSLMEPGVALYIDTPVEVLPKGVPWQPIIEDVKAFLRAEASTFERARGLALSPQSFGQMMRNPIYRED